MMEVWRGNQALRWVRRLTERDRDERTEFQKDS